MIRSLFYVFLAVGLVAGSFWLINFTEPEQFEVATDDGRLTLRGLARDSQPFQVMSVDAEDEDLLFGPVYTFEPSEYVLEEPAEILIHSEDDEKEAVLYRYDEGLMMWSHLPGNRVVDVDQLGRFRLGKDVRIASPNFLTTYDTLRARAPEGTVGFQMATAIRTGDSSDVQVPDSEQVGGCGGIVGAGRHEERSTVEQSARVLLNDVETLVTFTFVARWFVGAGCEPGESLEAFAQM